MKDNNQESGLSQWAKLSGIAFEMIAIIGGGTFLGYKLDSKFQFETPILTIILSLLSVAISTYVIIRRVKQINKNDKT